MKKYVLFGAAAALAGFMALAPAQAQNKRSANRLVPDTSFAEKAAQGGMAEVQLGTLAKDHASNPDVKQFGQTMVDDHTKAGDELKEIAGKKGITLPSGLNAKDQATYNRLSKLNGAAFDKAYMNDMVTDHRADVAEFQHEADHGSDADLKAFASKTATVVQHHLQMAESIQAKVK